MTTPPPASLADRAKALLTDNRRDFKAPGGWHSEQFGAWLDDVANLLRELSSPPAGPVSGEAADHIAARICAEGWAHHDAHKPFTVANFSAGNLARCYLEYARTLREREAALAQVAGNGANSRIGGCKYCEPHWVLTDEQKNIARTALGLEPLVPRQPAADEGEKT